MPALTQHEQDLLRRYRQSYLDLVKASGCPVPTLSGASPGVAAGRLPPVTEHERLWVRWRRMVRDRSVRAIKQSMGPNEPSTCQAVTDRPDAHHRSRSRCHPGLQPR